MSIINTVLAFFENQIGLAFLSNKYFAALFIVVGAIVLSQIMLLVFNLYLKQIAKKTATQFDDLIFEYTKQPLFFFILLWGLRLALIHIDVDGIVSIIVKSAMAIIFLYLLMRITDVAIQSWGNTIAKKTETQIDEVLLPFFHKIAKALFVIIGIVWMLHIWGVDITPYLAGAGIAGIILGLALQDSLKNILGGISLLLDKTYQVGDKVSLENGDVGEIADIGLRSTKMVTYDNEVLYVPNGYMANSKVRNFARPDPRVRVKLEFSTEYGSDLKEVRKAVLSVIRDMDDVLSKPEPAVNFLAMGDFALKFRVVFWIPKWDREFQKKVEATEKIYNALNKAKIGIPYPTSTVYLKKSKDFVRSARVKK